MSYDIQRTCYFVRYKIKIFVIYILIHQKFEIIFPLTSIKMNDFQLIKIKSYTISEDDLNYISNSLSEFKEMSLVLRDEIMNQNESLDMIEINIDNAKSNITKTENIHNDIVRGISYGSNLRWNIIKSIFFPITFLYYGCKYMIPK